MKPGYELDKLIAEKIFNMVECDGWTPVNYGSAGGFMLQKDCDHEANTCWPKQTAPHIHGQVGGCPRYSTDFIFTKEVLNKLLSTIPEQDIHIEHLESTGWQVGTCFDYKFGWEGWVRGKTIEHAICLAALLIFKVPDVDLGEWITDHENVSEHHEGDGEVV
jgi:hypothetical protein